MPSYRVKIVRAGQEFEAEGDKGFVLDMLKRFDRPTETGSKSDKAFGDVGDDVVQSPQASKGISLREFIRRLALKKHTDILVAFAYYLEKYAGVAEFTPADIKNCYYEAKMETSNTSQMIIQNVKRGFVMPVKTGGGGRSRYTVTATGEQFIEQKLGINKE